MKNIHDLRCFNLLHYAHLIFPLHWSTAKYTQTSGICLKKSKYRVALQKTMSNNSAVPCHVTSRGDVTAPRTDSAVKVVVSVCLHFKVYSIINNVTPLAEKGAAAAPES